MRLSQLFTKTRKDAPADETARSAQLLIRAGFIHKEMAGAYMYLPLGKRVLDKIGDIVREEMDAVGGQELLMTALQAKERFEPTNRWDDSVVDVWFKTKLAGGAELGLGFSHEEPLALMLTNHVSSYKDLPFLAYQIQTKFRNELRAKSGIMRGREFLMKDMYSFARSQTEHEELYEQIKQAYFKICQRLGIGDQTFLTFASGGSFSKFSHEFQTLTEAGEDTIYLDRSKGLAVNQEVLNDEVLDELGLQRDQLEEVRGAEVGNIFSLGTKFSAPFKLEFTDEQGQQQPIIMGCYGFGVSRTMGVVAELLSDDKGLVWPAAIAPAKVHIVQIGEEEAVRQAAEQLYQLHQDHQIDALYDDRSEVSAGEKLADADLMGIPLRVVVSQRTLEQQSVEIKGRTEAEPKLVPQAEAVNRIQHHESVPNNH